MKRGWVLLFAALVAFPSAAQQTETTEDSPLVAAAKRSNRLGKKPAVVITNATLASTGSAAHVTTTRTQRPLKQLPAPEAAKPAASHPRPHKRTAETAKAENENPAAGAGPHDDADSVYEETEREDLVQCSTCLPVLDPVPGSVTTEKAQPASMPPRIVPPQTVPASKKNRD